MQSRALRGHAHASGEHVHDHRIQDLEAHPHTFIRPDDQSLPRLLLEASDSQPSPASDWRALAFQAFPGLPVNGSQHAHMGQGQGDTHGPGRLTYFLPLGQAMTKGSNTHHWGDPTHSMWCCYGTGIESMAKLADSIFFWRWACRSPCRTWFTCAYVL